ncbi:MAG: hypothetical protein ACFCVC_15970 [Acidimicrobiia bacterium]
MTSRTRRLAVVLMVAAPLAEVIRHAVLFAGMGATADKDLFDAAWTIPDLMVLALAGPYLTLALAPAPGNVFGSDRETIRTTTAVVRLVSLVVVTLTALGVALSNQLAGVVFPRVADTVALAGLMRVAFAAAMFVTLGGVLAAAASTRRDGWLVWMPGVHLLGVVVGGLVADGPESYGWGRLGGSAAGLILAAVMASRAGVTFEWTTPRAHRSLPGRWRTARPMIVMAVLFGSGAVWIRVAGQFAGEGSLGVIAAVHALVVLLAAIVGTHGLASPPIVSDNAWLRAAESAAVRLVITRSLLVAVLVGSLAHPITGVAYQWGLLSPEATDTAAILLMFVAPAIPLVAAAPLYLRVWAGRRRAAAITGLAGAAVAVAATWAGSQTLGSSGVVLGWVAWSAAITIPTAVAWHRANDRAVLSHLVVSALAAGAGGVIAVLLASVGDRLGVTTPVTWLVAAGAAVAAWMWVGRLVGLREATVGTAR